MNIIAAAGKTVGKVKTNTGKKFTDIKAAVTAGAVQGCAPFPEGVDFFGFYNDISEKEAQRFADGAFHSLPFHRLPPSSCISSVSLRFVFL